MVKRLTSFKHNGENITKHNHFVYTQIVDRNGFILTKYPFIQEYFEMLDEFIGDDHTQSIIDASAFSDSEIHKIMPSRFFKVVHPQHLAENWNSTQLEQGRVPKANHMFFKGISGALASTEEYHKGIVWFFGGFKMFNTLAPFLNRVYLLRLNCDFGEICPELLDTDGMFDHDMLKQFGLNHLKVIDSEKSKKWVEIMSKPAEKVKEIVSDSMTLITSNDDVKKEQADIPPFFDYQFEEYSYTTKFVPKTKKQKDEEKDDLFD